MPGRERRQGLTKTDHRASGLKPLHEGAKDSRAIQLPTKASPIDNDEDINAPPQDSDDEAEVSGAESDPDDLIGRVKPISSSAPVPGSSYSDDTDDLKVFNPQGKRKYSSRRTYQMARNPSKQQIPRPPLKRHIPPINSASRHNKAVDKAFASIPPPTEFVPSDKDHGFTHIPTIAHESLSKSDSEKEIFLPPPKAPSESVHHDNDVFIDPAETIGISSAPPQKSYTTLEALNAYFRSTDKSRKRKKKKETKHDIDDIATAASPPKKARITPEPIFCVPPEAPKPDLAEGIPLEVAYDSINDEDTSKLSQPEFQDISSSGTMISSIDSNKCPLCLAIIDSALMELFKNQKKTSEDGRLTIRQQELLHARHTKQDAKALWQERYYPVIIWKDFPQRLRTQCAHIESIIEGRSEPYSLVRLRQNLPARGRKTATLAEEMKTGEGGAKRLGYYGTRGQRVIGDWVLSEYSAQLKQKSNKPDFTLAGGVGGFVQKVIIPEIIQFLIIDDIQHDSMLEEAARSRADGIIRTSVDDIETLTHVEKDCYRSARVMAAEAGISSSTSELERKDQIPWLARYIAMESAQCGILLSEEVEDIVPINPTVVE